jgi:hypothetical protein
MKILAILKTLAIRSALLSAFILALLFGSFESSAGDIIWTTVMATAFTFAVIYLTGRARIFISTALVAITAAAPFAILCRIALPGHGTWSASAEYVAYNIFHFNTLHGLELFIPSAVAIVLMLAFGHRAGPTGAQKSALITASGAV